MLELTGYLEEVGDTNVMTGRHERRRGFLLTCEGRDVKLDGLSKEECRALAPSIGRSVTIRVTVNGGSAHD